MSTQTYEPSMSPLMVAERLADTLEQLAALVNRELNVEASEGSTIDDPLWAAAIARVVDQTNASIAVLDEPAVLDALRPIGRSEG